MVYLTWKNCKCKSSVFSLRILMKHATLRLNATQKNLLSYVNCTPCSLIWERNLGGEFGRRVGEKIRCRIWKTSGIKFGWRIWKSSELVLLYCMKVWYRIVSHGVHYHIKWHHPSSDHIMPYRTNSCACHIPLHFIQCFMSHLFIQHNMI